MTGRGRLVVPAFLGLGLGTILLVAVASAAASPGSIVNELLRSHQLSAAELRVLDGGGAVVKSLDTPVRRELAHVGVVHIDVSPDRFVDRFRDIERFERGPGTPLIGRFAVPPRPEDVAALTLPARDLTALSTCRPGDCDVKLSTAAMARFRNQVDWSSPNAALQAHGVARAVILELVHAYQANGNPALGEYADGGEPLLVAEEFRALLRSSNLLPLPVAELMAYLEEYPRRQPSGAEEFFYWSMVDFGLKPTIRVNHVIIYPLAARPSGVSHVIAIKQLYASHYFQTTLELRFLVDDERHDDPSGFYLLSITRSRIDGMSGLKGSILRPVVSRRSRTAVRSYLEYLKRQVERPAPF